MIAIFCGSREWTDMIAVHSVMEKLLPRDLTVIHGDQRGADLCSDTVARKLGVPVISVPAEWTAYGDAAGPERNERMKQMLVRCGRLWAQPVGVYAFHHDPKLGVGTRDMVRRARIAGIKSHVFLAAGDDYMMKTMRRASGDVECAECGFTYYKHPPIISELDQNQEPYLVLDCDGTPLKL